MTNDLIVAPTDQTEWYTGLGIAESIADIAAGVESENWIETGIGIFATAAEAAAWATDPLGQLIQYGVSWIMEHFQPLRDALDWLAGDPPQIEAYAQTWSRVSTFVAATGTTLLDKSRADTATWQGAASDAYRSYAGSLAQAVTDTAKTAELISYVVSIAGMLVAAVRELVRDMIAELVAIVAERIWVWAAEAATVVGAPAAEAQVAALAAKWIGKVARVIAKLCRSLNSLKGLTDKLDEIWDLLTKAWRRFRHDGEAAPGFPNKDAIARPNSKTPRVGDGGTSPSSTTPSDIPKSNASDATRPSKDSENATVPSAGSGSGNKPPRDTGSRTSPGDDPEDPRPEALRLAEARARASEAAQARANAEQTRPNANKHTRPTSAAGLSVPGQERTFSGASVRGGGEHPNLHPDVQAAYDRVPDELRAPGNQHGRCGEPQALSEALNAGVDPRGGTMASVEVRAEGNPRHGTPKPPCSSCQHVLDQFGITAVAD